MRGTLLALLQIVLNGPSQTRRDPHAGLRALIRREGLDQRSQRRPDAARAMLDYWTLRAEVAWSSATVLTSAEDSRVAIARLDTQRALYELNRLNLYWFDAPESYTNERSRVLFDLRERLEGPWQAWLGRQVTEAELNTAAPHEVLRAWTQRDLHTPVTGDDWFSQKANLTGYRRLLEIVSLNGLVEASQLSRVMGGAPHPAQATLFRILMEEYGAGRLHKKHSHFFARMLEAQGLSVEPEAYFASVPWAVLSSINQAFYLTENRRFYLRFCGAFTYTELSTPVGFRGYAAAAKRLGLSDGHDDYWALHVREDERHGAWMVDEVAGPLLAQFPAHARELLFGYAQQRFVESIASAATEHACRKAQGETGSP